MATQHPDNACAPYWKSTPAISTTDEVEDCFRAFSDLACDEYMWDWEGKFVDEAVIDRLFNRYADYFKKNQLGRDKFLTFRIPNIWQERGVRLARAFMAIITAAQTARDYKSHIPPLFEVILPMTTSADQLIQILQKFERATRYEKAIFEEEVMGHGRLEMIPLVEGSASLFESADILRRYVMRHAKLFGKKPAYLRPFIARSDPALDAGFVPATLAARAAIARYADLENELDLPIHPIIGVGGLSFRGGLSPHKIDRFLELYSGVRTVTVQSAFRYDFSMEDVKKAITRLARELPKRKPVDLKEVDLKKMALLSDVFASHYRPVVEALARDINDLAVYIPQHRERIPHSGHFGYSRKIGKTNVTLPRAITFTAVFSSLGVPPSLIGTGRALKAAIANGDEALLTRAFPGFERDLFETGHYLNWENLKFLAKTSPAWAAILDDVRFLESYLGKRLEPISAEHFIHRNLTSTIYHLWKKRQQSGKESIPSEKISLSETILQAGRIRKSLG